MEENLSWCEDCEAYRENTHFSVSYRLKDGTPKYHKQCKPCRSKRNSIRNMERYYSDPSFKEKAEKWRIRNPDKVRIYKRREYQKNKDRYTLSGRRWLESNRVKVRQIKRRYKLKRREWVLRGEFTQAEWDALVSLYGGKCLACGRRDRKLTQDHIVPLSKGGSNTIENIQPLCGPCNSSKHTKIIDYRRR